MNRSLVVGGGFGVAAQLSALGLLLTSGWLVVRAAEHPPVLYLMVAITSVRMFGVARAALRYAERLRTHDAALKRAIGHRVEVYRALARIAPSGLLGRRHGDVVRTVVTDVESVQDGLLRIRLPWIGAIVTVSVTALVLFVLLPPAGAVFTVFAAVCLLVLRLLVPVLAVRHDIDQRVSGDVTELVRAAPDLVAFGSARGRDAQAHRAIDALAQADRRRAWAGGVGSLFVLATSAVCTFFIALAVVDAGLTGPVVGVLLLAPIGMVDVLDAVAEAERLRPQVVAAQRRIDALVAAPDPLPVPSAAGSGLLGGTGAASLQLRNVTLGWDRDLVAGVDAQVPAGGTLVVTGPSGSGKSTLAATVSRLVAARAGQVVIDGVDVMAVSTAEVRAVVGWMGQDAVVLDTTLRENLRIADPGAADAALWAALRRVRLAATVATWPEGLDTVLGEAGAVLSGGERQRLALARMLLAGHRVLVLDEPTEHLDQPTAEALLDDIDALAPEHTVVIISHAPDVVARYEHRLDLGERGRTQDSALVRSEEEGCCVPA